MCCCRSPSYSRICALISLSTGFSFLMPTGPGFEIYLPRRVHQAPTLCSTCPVSGLLKWAGETWSPRSSWRKFWCGTELARGQNGDNEMEEEEEEEASIMEGEAEEWLRKNIREAGIRICTRIYDKMDGVRLVADIEHDPADYDTWDCCDGMSCSKKENNYCKHILNAATLIVPYDVLAGRLISSLFTGTEWDQHKFCFGWGLVPGVAAINHQHLFLDWERGCSCLLFDRKLQ